MRMTTLARAAMCALSFGLCDGQAARATESLTADPGMDVQEAEHGLIVSPGSTRERREGFVRTNLHLLVPYGEPMFTATPSGNGETPASLACVYGLTAPVSGCNPLTLTTVATGGARTIAVVDAYDYPTALADLQKYSNYYHLTPVTTGNFKVVYASGTKPAVDATGAWELEAALDIEMVHALAPGANLILVEAASTASSDMFSAVQKATALVSKTGGEVSLSWSSQETAFETAFASVFARLGVVVLAATGDSPGTSFPSVLTNVIGVGGTTLNRDGNSNLISQTAWSSGGGGASQYVGRPAFQAGVASVVHTARGTPDIAMVANPNSPVWAYDSTSYHGSAPGWFRVGGTSAATPLAAALLNVADASLATSPNTAAELTKLYQNRLIAADYIDITSGACGYGSVLRATAGYDLCTGIGAPFGLGGK